MAPERTISRTRWACSVNWNVCADHQLQSLLVGAADEVPGVVGRQDHRLFYQDVGSGVQRVPRDLVVVCVGHCYDNSIDAFQQVMVVEECAVDLVVGSGGLKLVGVGIGYADEVGPIIGPETGDMSSGRPPSRTDNAHSGSSHQGTPDHSVYRAQA